MFEKLFKTVPGSIILGSLIISTAILITGDVIRVKGLSSRPVSQDNEIQAAAQPSDPSPNAPPPADSGPVKVSIDDDPILGDKKAAVTIIEFSDYECPFCKKAYQEILSSLKKSYIDTGKVRFVYRDLPLPFHQNASKLAQAASCARDQGGDAAYYKYHDQIFEKFAATGPAPVADQLMEFAKTAGLNTSKFSQCLESEKYKAEAEKDIADAQKAGASGTPTWFIGKTSSDGTIDATKVVGAVPFVNLEEVIKKQL